MERRGRWLVRFAPVRCVEARHRFIAGACRAGDSCAEHFLKGFVDFIANGVGVFLGGVGVVGARRGLGTPDEEEWKFELGFPIECEVRGGCIAPRPAHSYSAPLAASPHSLCPQLVEAVPHALYLHSLDLQNSLIHALI